MMYYIDHLLKEMFVYSHHDDIQIIIIHCKSSLNMLLEYLIYNNVRSLYYNGSTQKDEYRPILLCDPLPLKSSGIKLVFAME